MAEADNTPFRVDKTRASYDAVADEYAAQIAGELAGKPFDRAFLDRVADTQRRSAEAGFHGLLVELGCGPGHVAGYLRDRGVDVQGLDLSPRMVEIARRRRPDIEFVVGDMLALPYADRSLTGVIAFYSIIHFDDTQLARALGEMARVVRPWGSVVLAFHVGDESLHLDDWWGRKVDIDFRLLSVAHVTRLMRAAGIHDLVTAEERDPYPPPIEHQSRRAYIVGSPLPPLELGYAGTELRRTLVDAVLRGEKTATAGLAWDHQPHTHEPLPRPFDRWALLDYDDRPVAIVETTQVSVVPAGKVDLDFARAEGEGFESVAEWRAAHERFWSGQAITDQTPIVCEHFRVAEIL